MNQNLKIKITRASLPAQVADRIQDLIESGTLQMGEKLPPERELAEKFGVSRPVLREALQVLVVRGLVQVKPGCGTFIQEPTTQNAADYLELYFKLRHCPGSLREFYEMRQLLEVEAAGMAAERSTAADVKELWNNVEVMQGLRQSLSGYVSADLQFHLLLARAAHNEYLIMLIGPLAGIWSQVISISAEAPGAIQAGIAFHQEILEKLDQHDVFGAREVMRKHMQAALEFSVISQQISADNCSQ